MGAHHEHRLPNPPSLSALAAAGIRERIVSGELKPGERLREATLAEQFGVSRPPLREAFQQLAQENLVELLPRRGARVSPLTLQDAYEIVTLRHALEETAVTLAIPLKDHTRIAPLEQAVQTMQEHAASARENLAVDDSMAVHIALVDLAGHALLSDAYRRLTGRIRTCMNLNRQHRHQLETLTDRAARHQQILDAVYAGDLDAITTTIHDPKALSFLAALEDTLHEASDEAQAWFAEALTR